MRLADQMTNEQLDEFETFYNAKDDAGAFKWLETNFPNYKDIVADEFQNLKAEIAQSAPQILAASQQQAENAPATPQPQQMYPPQTPPASQSPEPPANAQY
jgi:predicted RNA-binding Zn ribbon-like protein